jgi:hypothetical protein
MNDEQYKTSAEDMRVTGNWLIVHGVDENELKQGKHKFLKTTAISHARYLIRRYGTDGYGDEPPTMNVFEYWLSHLDFESITQNANSDLQKYVAQFQLGKCQGKQTKQTLHLG